MLQVEKIQPFPKPLAEQPGDEAVAHKPKFEEVPITHLISSDYVATVLLALPPS